MSLTTKPDCSPGGGTMLNEPAEDLDATAFVF